MLQRVQQISMNKGPCDVTVVKPNVLETLRSQKDSTLIAWTIIIEFSFVLAVIAYWSAVLGWQVDLRPANVIFGVLIAFVSLTVGMHWKNRGDDKLDAHQEEIRSDLKAHREEIKGDLKAHLEEIKSMFGQAGYQPERADGQA